MDRYAQTMRGKHMEAEIREQATQLAAVQPAYADVLAALAGQEFSTILLAARGSSDHAALYGRYLMEVHLGIPVVLAAPSVLTRYGRRVRYPRCLAVGISQSGAAPDVSEVLAAAREDGHATLAITNTAGSRLATTAEHTLLLNVGTEKSVAATKTYSASLLAMYELTRALGANLPAPTLPNEAWIASARSAAEDASGTIVRCSPVFALARGFDFATANEAALKLMECACLPVKSYSSADFEHGPKALAGPGSAAIAFGLTAEGIRDQGCEIVVAPEPPAPEESCPFWNVVFAQWLALFAARARGLDPDAPRHLRKVTETR